MKIKFSHKYRKLSDNEGGHITSAILLMCKQVYLEDLSSSFLDYDTDYGLFSLPKKGLFLMLLFSKNDGVDLFTTLRRYTDEKFQYYSDAVGEIFDIEYKPEAQK